MKTILCHADLPPMARRLLNQVIKLSTPFRHTCEKVSHMAHVVSVSFHVEPLASVEYLGQQHYDPNNLALCACLRKREAHACTHAYTISH